MLVSGSLPMSSALTTSTTEVDSRLAAIDVSIECRMPVTTTSSRTSSLASHPARRATPLLPASTAATAAATEFTATLPLFDVPRRNPCPVRIFIVIPPTSDRRGKSQVQGTCSESGSLLLKRYKVIRSSRITGNGKLPTLSCETYGGRMGVSISRSPFILRNIPMLRMPLVAIRIRRRLRRGRDVAAGLLPDVAHSTRRSRRPWWRRLTNYSSLSWVLVRKSPASCRSRSWFDGSPVVRLTLRPRCTAGRALMVSAQRRRCVYSFTCRNSAAPS